MTNTPLPARETLPRRTPYATFTQRHGNAGTETGSPQPQPCDCPKDSPIPAAK